MDENQLDEIARVLVRFNRIASAIVNADHSNTRAAAVLRIADCNGSK
jgi:hypothetical protein